MYGIYCTLMPCALRTLGLRCNKCAFSGWSNWVPAQQFFQQLHSYFVFARRVVVLVLGQRKLATADAHFFICQILGALKKGNLSNYPFHLDCSWPRSTQVQQSHLAVFFIDTGNPERRSKQRWYSDKHSLPQ